MHRKTILESLNQYQTSRFFFPEERDCQAQFIEFIKANPSCFERENAGHITGSAWIINHDGTRELLNHHKKLNKWLQFGGHADGNPDVATVALEEAHEETGIANLSFVTQLIYDIGIHPLAKCVYHYDVCYLIRAPKGAQYTMSEESIALAWVPLDEIEQYTKSRSVLRMVAKMKLLS